MSYKIGIVYRIVCLSNPELPPYIGSTFNQLRHRWRNHKANYKKYLKGEVTCVSIFPYFTQYGIENFKILKIKEYLVYREHEKDRRHLSVYEQLWMNKLKNVNKCNSIPFLYVRLRTKLYNQQYHKDKAKELSTKNKIIYIENRDKILEQKKDYHKRNKDKINEKHKKYWEDNKDRLHEKQKVKNICDCGGKYTHTNKGNHNKTKKHQAYLESLNEV